MFAAYAARFDDADPLSALETGDVPDPTPPDGWVVVDIVASALNHHDLWSLRGVGLAAEQLPMILGCDAAGRDPEGNEVVVYSVVADPESGKTSILSEKFPGTLAQKVAVPRSSLVPKPAELSFAEAACLPTAWLTAYRMLVSCGQVTAGSSVLVQGAGGGVATAAVAIGTALGATVYATSRDASKRERAEKLGAIPLESGARVPKRVDCVIETVGEATFDHSLKSLKPGGRLVVSGATSGHLPRVDLRRVFFLDISILGTSMGSAEELAALMELCARTGLRPIIDSTFPLSRARDAFAHLQSGDVFGKVVLENDL
ncbi:zinc-binding dehydrogenase [Cryptosporangium phraense]|uniref:Zinc-binding dehydrogenase n=1 Tax=Cryptosporangium phraense TaxID=2593070 RepID=A0A545ALR2_9ACTN|nr:zinc-binding dehydrogenase [Cryptosporangium phraense]TQS42264.1 zinc-binding dehydrogenase [Cryptosporangium phraense]